MYDPDDRRSGSVRFVKSLGEASLSADAGFESYRLLEFVEPLRRLFYFCVYDSTCAHGDYRDHLRREEETRLEYADQHSHGGFLAELRLPDVDPEVVHARFFPMEFLGGDIDKTCDFARTRDELYSGPTNRVYPQKGNLCMFSESLIGYNPSYRTLSYLRRITQSSLIVGSNPFNFATLEDFLV